MLGGGREQDKVRKRREVRWRWKIRGSKEEEEEGGNRR